ncbi:DUF2617 family protein [Micromonospora sagamiensis]|uniref:Uncharacterized protein DUF2617 n=1 Tax=Micromonospora sagamiensis TaxID=47875 RepID=A0A562WRC9_9ACTN|nr:DUF2617 family protein [Micromonospora sagamiensis]TWJ31944.1 uncharacterized protein DUF2617 [Micromonospora sagamiensis]BCL15002.1 hypothetical protein GCM10017556_27410 [Micromonospora sagamiensis]
MLVSLDAPYVDTSAADLSLAFGGPELPALYVLDLDLPGGRRIRLRLLGASHQVLLRGPAPAGTPDPVVLAETVACLPGRRPDLPSTVHEPADGYSFSATVLRPEPGGLSSRVAALRTELADDPYALVGVFPGDPDAVTALAVVPDSGSDSVRWRTWHAYPQTNELVLTETVVTL